jgi:1-acyl-sn-glycerol-3-phosphate acyltransferase
MRFPADSSFAWKALYLVAEFLKFFCCRVTVEGAENIPETGGVVLACNHNPGFDFAMLGYASSRQVYFMAKKEIFDINPLLSKLLFAVGAFPILRGKHDQRAIASAVQLVESGKVLGMFPEGTRSRTGKLQRAHSGAAHIAMEANAPVAPTVVIGSEKAFSRIWPPWNRPLVIIRFAPPIILQNPADDQLTARQYTNRIMCAIAELLPPEHRGFYANCGALEDKGRTTNDEGQTTND